ncbi:unnamed protein product [Hydatigera taeniaeformis]|uniref:Uncharacterized protein n=1 Tax=Hydatigena taeniaeformis TaxID=6205 RepID=A0A0R3WR27_HYDTA|nr:unnamed protein product [Hydatigera taeniaeformis]
MESYDRPDPEEVRRVYRRSWHFTLVAVLSFLTMGGLIIPGVFYIFNFLDITSFTIWIYAVLFALIVSAAVTLFMPLVWEAIHLYRLRQTRTRLQVKQHTVPQPSEVVVGVK